MGDNPKQRHLRRQRRRAEGATLGGGSVLDVAAMTGQGQLFDVDDLTQSNEAAPHDLLATAEALATLRASQDAITEFLAGIRAEQREELVELRRRIGDLRSAGREAVRVYREEIRNLNEEADEARRIFREAKAELQRQRESARRSMEQARERSHALQDEMRAIQERIVEARRLGQDYLLPYLQASLEGLQSVALERGRELRSCRSELKGITEDIQALAQAKRLDDEDRRELLAGIREDLAEFREDHRSELAGLVDDADDRAQRLRDDEAEEREWETELAGDDARQRSIEGALE